MEAVAGAHSRQRPLFHLERTMGRYALLQVWCVWVALGSVPAQADEWDRLTKLGDQQSVSGNYSAALTLYRQALKIAESADPADPRLAATLDYLGNIYGNLGNWQESERQFRRALGLMESIAGRESIGYGLLQLDLGTMYGNSGRTDRAERPLRDALAILMRVLPANDTRIAIARGSYATVMMQRGRYREAEDLLRQDLAVLEKQPERACVPIGHSYNTLGMVLRREGRSDEALALFEQAVQTIEACKGPDHPAVVQALNNLAIQYADAHKNADADATFLRALAICERRLGADHPMYGGMLWNYASFLRQTKRKSEAKKVAAQSQSVLRESARRNGDGLLVDVSSFRQ
jgi:tetratricopeptide (TPR) repeat protein